MMTEQFAVTGMTCAACSAHVEKAVSRLSGVQSAPVNLMLGSMTVTYDEKAVTEGDIIAASDSITPQQIAFMMNHARGLICVAMPGERRFDPLDIAQVAADAEDHASRTAARCCRSAG